MKLSKYLSSEQSDKIQASFLTHNFKSYWYFTYPKWLKQHFNHWKSSANKIYHCKNCGILFFNWNDTLVSMVTNSAYLHNFHNPKVMATGNIIQTILSGYQYISCNDYIMESILK